MLLVRRCIQQPAVGILLCTLAIAVLAGAWQPAPGDLLTAQGLQAGLVGLFLVAALVAASLYPIHIQHHTKISLTSVPLYAIAILLPPLLAMLATGVGILIEQLLTRTKRGSQPIDIATSVSRLMLAVFLAARLSELAAANELPLTLALFGSACALFLSDVFTCALEITAVSGDSLLRTLAVLIREGGPFEAAQYLLGILGVLAAFQEIWALGLLVFPIGFVYVAYRNTKEMHISTRQIMESMADAVDLRDPYTGGHSRRVAAYCAGILEEWPMRGVEAELILTAARVHDIGKIAIPDSVLNKPGRFTDEERTTMESHAERGAEFLARYPNFARGVAIVRHHHERWDGQGYPAGLSGFAIPFGARVIAVADSFDAMTSDRPYRRGRSYAEAAAVLREDGGQQWEPAVVEAFLRSIAEILPRSEGSASVSTDLGSRQYVDPAHASNQNNVA